MTVGVNIGDADEITAAVQRFSNDGYDFFREAVPAKIFAECLRAEAERADAKAFLPTMMQVSSDMRIVLVGTT